MKTRVTVAVAWILTLLVAPAGAAQFEGVITQRTITVERYALEERGFDLSGAPFDVPIERILALRDALEESGEMTVVASEMSVKGGLVRMDMETGEGPSWVTIDIDRGIMRMVRPDERMYIEMTQADLERMQQMRGAMGREGPSDAREPVATGQSRTIAGFHTEAYDLAEDDGATRVWVSKDNAGLVTAFAALMDHVGRMSMEDDVGNLSALITRYGFPVLMQSVTADEYEIQELVSVRSQAVSDAVFAPPPGFRKMTMADLMRR